MIDMHIHTIYSDGIDSVQNIFKNANKLNLSTISITDHNTVSAYEEIMKNDWLKLYKGKLIPGVELKCHFNKEIIELLVYDFRIEEMRQFINNNYSSWEYINRTMTEEFEKILNSYDISYDKSIMLTHDFTKYNGIMELYKSVIGIDNNQVKIGDEFNKDITEFFRKSVCNEDSRFYVDLSKYYPSIEDIFSFVNKNDGKVFMPHVYLFSNGFNILKCINNNYVLDGVECYHPSYELEECQELIKYCKDNNLLISAGSDYHGNGYGLGEVSSFYDDNNIKTITFKNIVNRK